MMIMEMNVAMMTSSSSTNAMKMIQTQTMMPGAISHMAPYAVYETTPIANVPNMMMMYCGVIATCVNHDDDGVNIPYVSSQHTASTIITQNVTCLDTRRKNVEDVQLQ